MPPTQGYSYPTAAPTTTTTYTVPVSHAPAPPVYYSHTAAHPVVQQQPVPYPQAPGFTNSFNTTNSTSTNSRPYTPQWSNPDQLPTWHKS
eukprot:CAMPEP_0174252944 /NCGR_PEP_ID=MMETSP0439-20130205/2322_1 /TAXON_ID=0 /ORGANISM="Stereomyxa ramosa, Strain Chinc5" /LENGTH=89 /DNA_ID=CAMNT_0015333673 /DNA_START=249 /DNA_END=515 /DNA_ORIENTATION=+